MMKNKMSEFSIRYLTSGIHFMENIQENSEHDQEPLVLDIFQHARKSKNSLEFLGHEKPLVSHKTRGFPT